jgi:hypothetical protein
VSSVIDRIIHISFGGPERWISVEKPYRFEDHHYCGPIVLGKNGDPLENQPPERHRFWLAVNAWYRQGKRTVEAGGKVWCVYETEMAAKRKAGRIVREELQKAKGE